MPELTYIDLFYAFILGTVYLGLGLGALVFSLDNFTTPLGNGLSNHPLALFILWYIWPIVCPLYLAYYLGRIQRAKARQRLG